MSRFSRAVAQFGDTRIPLAPPLLPLGFACPVVWKDGLGGRCGACGLPVRGNHASSDPAPEAAPVRSFTGTVTMPTEPKTQKPRDFLRFEARKADREADMRESAWKGGKVNMYPSTEPNYAWNRGYAAGIRVALCILAEKSEDSSIDRVRCPKCDDTGRTCPDCGAA